MEGLNYYIQNADKIMQMVKETSGEGYKPSTENKDNNLEEVTLADEW